MPSPWPNSCQKNGGSNNETIRLVFLWSVKKDKQRCRKQRNKHTLNKQRSARAVVRVLVWRVDWWINEKKWIKYCPIFSEGGGVLSRYSPSLIQVLSLAPPGNTHTMEWRSDTLVQGRTNHSGGKRQQLDPAFLMHEKKMCGPQSD